MTKRIIYIVGLMVVFIMGLGLLLNFGLSFLGISRPLSTIPTLISFWVCVIVFIFFYVRKKHFKLSLPRIPISVYLLILLPVFAIVGAELVNFTQNNVLLMILMVLIVVVLVICMFTKLIPKKYWSFTIWMIALAVILHRALISQDLWGADNIIEYGCFRVTEMNGFWTSSILNTQCPNYNTDLSVTILPAMLSKITFINGFWIFKVGFAVLLSVVPVVIYELVKSQFNSKIGFLASLLVMASYPFFTVMLSTNKQLVAVVLISVFLLMMVDKGVKFKPCLLFALGLGIIVSHYATAGLFIVLVFVTSVIFWNKSKQLPVLLPLILGVGWLAWYWFADDGVVIKQFLNIGQDAVTVAPTLETVPNPNIDPKHNWALNFAVHGSNYMPVSMLVFYIMMHVFIGIGIIVKLWQWIFKKDYQVTPEYLVYSSLFIFVLVCEVVLPRFSTIFALDRVFPIYIIAFAPFMIVGFIFITRKYAIILSALFISVFFLLNTGFIYEVIGQPLGSSIALSQDKEDFPVFTSQEIKGGRWVYDNLPINKVYYDDVTRGLFNYIDVTRTPITGQIPGAILSRNYGKMLVSNKIPEGSYIFLRRFNVRENRLSLGYPDYALLEVKLILFEDLGEFSSLLKEGIVVYENRDCKVIRTTYEYEGNK
jgi:uncharacterized membrane protein